MTARPDSPLIDPNTQALAAERAIVRYMKRYAETLAAAGWTQKEIAVEIKRLTAAVRDKVLTGKAPLTH